MSEEQAVPLAVDLLADRRSSRTDRRKPSVKESALV
jgi:hypothetical protein